MRNRRTFSNPATNCICNGCGAEAEAIPGKTHRKCGRKTGKARQNGAQYGRIPALFRGIWEAGRDKPAQMAWTEEPQRIPSLMAVA